MASRRFIAPLAQRATSSSSLAPHICSRHAPQQTRVRILAPTLAARLPAQPLVTPRRHYSQQAASRIWSFEDVQSATQAGDSKVVIVDTREPGELKQTGHIPGAVNIPITSSPDSFHISADEFEDKFGFPRPGQDTELVFYCKAGVRSRAAAGLARDAGWSKVGEYPGSWMDWSGRGGKVER